MLKTFGGVFLGFFIGFIAMLFINTARFSSVQHSVPASKAPSIIPSALENFQRIIQFKTVSYADPRLFDSIPFLQLQQYLQQAYPLVHQQLTRELISDYTLLYHWKGMDTSLSPLLLMAHMDVVPVEEANLSSWKTAPFAGTIKDSCIWGRGSWDNKINLVSILESTEKLLREHIQPKRSVYFLFSVSKKTGCFSNVSSSY
ncbi:MAG: M20/M25/M40 family metallo-hydrolase [Chitinophagaceae bacterium]